MSSRACMFARICVEETSAKGAWMRRMSPGGRGGKAIPGRG